MNAKVIELEAWGLPSDERAKLALDLIESLETLAPAEIERLWAAESQRRSRQIDNGEVQLLSSEVVAQRARELLG